MSIVVGIVNKNIAVVGSDTLIYSGYNIEEGRYAKPLHPYPKIFHHEKTGLMGGVTGMMDFNGIGIIENIYEILNSLTHYNHLDIIRNKLIQEIHRRMIIEPSCHNSKTVELILISKDEDGDNFEIYSHRFDPSNNGDIDITQKFYTSTKKIEDDYNFIFLFIGSARETIEYLRNEKPTKGVGMDYYLKICEGAVNYGIENCGSHPGADPNVFSPACGGEPQIKFITIDNNYNG